MQWVSLDSISLIIYPEANATEVPFRSRKPVLFSLYFRITKLNWWNPKKYSVYINVHDYYSVELVVHIVDYGSHGWIGKLIKFNVFTHSSKTGQSCKQANKKWWQLAASFFWIYFFLNIINTSIERAFWNPLILEIDTLVQSRSQFR